MTQDNNFLLKIFIHNKNGELVKEHFYDELVNVFNQIIDHNIEDEDDEWNIINGFQFPPKGLFWHVKEQKWKQIGLQIFRLM